MLYVFLWGWYLLSTQSLFSLDCINGEYLSLKMYYRGKHDAHKWLTWCIAQNGCCCCNWTQCASLVSRCCVFIFLKAVRNSLMISSRCWFKLFRLRTIYNAHTHNATNVISSRIVSLLLTSFTDKANHRHMSMSLSSRPSEMLLERKIKQKIGNCLVFWKAFTGNKNA